MSEGNCQRVSEYPIYGNRILMLGVKFTATFGIAQVYPVV
jgi:hypothetical protein